MIDTINLRRSGNKLIGDCPRCGYKNALTITEKNERQLFYCHAGCSPDSQAELLAAIRGGNHTHEYVRPVAPEPADASAQRYIRQLWQSSLPASGTIIETYLRTRDITIRVSASLRFLPRHLHKSTETYWPVMLAAVVDNTGKLQALHRTYITTDGKKAPVEPVKMTLGAIGGYATHLAKAGEKLAVTEGIETGLSVMQSTGIPTWAALSAGSIETLILPPLPLAGDIIIAADNDANGRGKQAADIAANRWLAEGRRVRIAMPEHTGQDFNDAMRGVAA